MQVLGATFEQYLFNFIFYVFLSFFSWKILSSNKTVLLLWILIVLFCVFSYFAGDWYNYKFIFPYISKDFKDPIYYYFAQLANGKYLVFRLLIWGLATLLFYISSWRLQLNRNVTAFVFVWLFLPTFCYARASLAMASYFCGLSFLLENKKRPGMIIKMILGVCLIISSFFFHRSFLPIIVATPLIFVKFNRKMVFLTIILFPFFIRILNLTLNMMMEDLVLEGEEFESFSKTAQGYTKQARTVYNWKYALVSNLKNIGLYIPFIYLLWKTKISKHRTKLVKSLDRILSIEIVIIVVSTAFFYLSSAAGLSDVLSYRFLYVTGIPSTFILTYLLQNKVISIRSSLYLMFCVWLSTIALLVGKLYVLA